MAQEILDELIEWLPDSEQDDFPKILEQVIYFNFIEDTTLSELLDIELDDLDELLSSSEHLTPKVWKGYRNKVLSYLKKERKRYERLYYSG